MLDIRRKMQLEVDKAFAKAGCPATAGKEIRKRVWAGLFESTYVTTSRYAMV
jgi:hypothetical protein